MTFETRNPWPDRFSESTDECEWCSAIAETEGLLNQKVCLKCYNLMKGAGLSDGETFGTDPKGYPV